MAKSIEANTRIILAKYPKGFRFPKYREHKPSGRAVIQFKSLWGDNPHYLNGDYASAESLRDYAACCDLIYTHKLNSLQAKQKPAELSQRKSHATVEEFLLDFMRWATNHYADEPKELQHFKVIARQMQQHCGKHQIRSVGPVLAKEIRELMILPQPPRPGQKPRVKPISRGHVNAQFNRMRSMFKWGIEHEYVTPDQFAILKAIAPLKPGKTMAIERPDVLPVPWEQVERVIPFMPPTLIIMVNVHRLTGMRSDELTKMTLAEIDRSDTVWVYRPDEHKNKWRGKTKNICIGPQAQELLAPLLNRGEHEFIFSPAEVQLQRNELRRLFSKTKRYGKRIEPLKSDFKHLNPRYFAGSYSHAINYARKKAVKFIAENKLPAEIDIAHWTPHQLRHLRATEAREKYSLEGAQVVLGNSREATQIYAETSLPLAKKIAAESG